MTTPNLTAAERDARARVHAGTATEADLHALITECDRLRDTVRALNRRAQRAESAAKATVEECERQGVSLGRSLAGWAYANQKRENAELLASRDTAWRAAIEAVRKDMNDEIIAAIDDPRHFKDERSGLRMARIIADRHCAALSALADRMGAENG